MIRFTFCPACSKPLKWHDVEVDTGGDSFVPEEAFCYADCKCGLGLTWSQPQPEAVTDPRQQALVLE